ncbi:sensor histidine kinase [Devosia rhizoryzae]|uniref:histidine kinase n=1 Tax=Devosia rhizoryzae TaxID=2774137 RepID=A0ABX7C5U1_9HYPH|nr:HWE histidine kinase domain-containing protein [Devosia rhizoryzae]QQR39615.1 PAS domain-containing protein [Devosia rhizoryzae]
MHAISGGGSVDTSPETTFLAGGGNLGALIRAYNWTSTPLGAPATWPGSLRTLVQVMLTSQQPMFIAWGPDRTMLYNDGYAPMCTNRHPWALGKPFGKVWADIIADVGPIMEAAYAGVPTYMDDIEFQMVRHGRTVETHFSFGYTPVHDENDQVAGMFCTALEITAEVVAAKTRTRELDRLRALLEKAPSFMAVLHGPEHRFEITNAAYRQLIGHRDVIGKTVREALPEIEGQGFYELLDGVYGTGQIFIGRSMEIDLQQTPDGPLQKGFLNFVYQPMYDDAGQITGIFVEGNDVTDLKGAELALRAAMSVQDTLTGELQHRIKNSLAMVGAIASQTLRGEDIADRRALFDSRLSALATAHDILTNSTWTTASLRDVVEGALAPHMPSEDRVTLQGIEFDLNPKQALSMALAIHELATNAAKYGAFSTPEGRVLISWAFDPAGEKPVFLFKWEESGGPPVVVPSRTGFGSRLITKVLAADFEGKVSVEYRPEGLLCVLRSDTGCVAPEQNLARSA